LGQGEPGAWGEEGVVEQRFVFNGAADAYDAFRPGYPPAVFDALKAAAPEGARTLEVGCGTGKATGGLADAGFQVLALDPGPAMLEKARIRVGEGRGVAFTEGVFEAFVPSDTSFDLICAAQAWHWVDPRTGYPKAASLLAPQGILAVFGNADAEIPGPLGSEIAAALTAALGRPQANLALAAYGADGWIASQWSGSGLFGPLRYERFDQEMEHDAQGFASLVATYSDVLMLEPPARARLLDVLMEAVVRHGGRFVRKVHAHLHLAEVRPI